jgi:hypothetical protein
VLNESAWYNLIGSPRVCGRRSIASHRNPGGRAEDRSVTMRSPVLTEGRSRDELSRQTIIICNENQHTDRLSVSDIQMAWIRAILLIPDAMLRIADKDQLVLDRAGQIVQWKITRPEF